MRIAAAEDADGLVALGGGSAIDTAKAVSAELRPPDRLDPDDVLGRGMDPVLRRAGSRHAHEGRRHGRAPRGVVYEPELTLDLPRDQTGGTALNALAHCAEALYVPGATPELDRDALAAPS